MKGFLLGAILLWQATAANEPPVATPGSMRYERPLQVAATTGQACAVLDGQIFPHAAPSLVDLRIFPATAGNGPAHEIPYVVTESEAVTDETRAARLMNLGSESGKIAFDLEMPRAAYTDVTLELDPGVKNFVATARVIGMNVLGRSGPNDRAAVDLGSFTLFDLTAQHLSRDTTLPLTESTFRYLHVMMDFANAPGGGPVSAAHFGPGIVEGATVPPSREAQILYTTVAETASIATVARESRAIFQLPVRVPVERVSFVLAPGFTGNFSRDVRVTALSQAQESGEDTRAPMPESVAGRIMRVHASEAGREIRSEELGVPAILGANLQGAAKVEIAVENGDDQPLPITAVRLEMRQREVCFDAAAAGAGDLALYYGDPRLATPVYDYKRLFAVSEKTAVARLGPEALNASYRAPAQAVLPFAERHPWVLWIALIAVIGALGLVAVRSSGRVKG